jgi:hypothetical protein
LSLHLPEAPQGWRPFAPILHLQQHELGRSLHLRTEPRVSPTPVVNHSSLRSGHPSTTGTLLVLMGPDGLTGGCSQIWVRSCILTRYLYRFRLLLRQDLSTLYLWRVTANWGEHNRIKHYLLRFILSTPFSTSMLLVSWSPGPETIS